MACKLGGLMGSRLVTKADRDLLVHWSETGTDVKGRTVSAEVMAVAIAKGCPVPVGPTTLKDHRAGRCACYREKASA